MSILIKGMTMPKEGSWKTVRIYPDGTCAVPNWQGDCTFIKGAEAIELPPHGRLIDADVLKELYDLGEELDYCHVTLPVIRQNIEDMPTIIEAEEVYDKYTDTAGNLHWTGTHSGKHIVKA